MLIVYDKSSHNIVSISGIRGNVTEEEVNMMNVIELPETQAEYRIYDNEVVNQVWQALDLGDGIELVFDGDIPTGVEIIDLPDPPIEEPIV